jgi:hypothetical protein
MKPDISPHLIPAVGDPCSRMPRNRGRFAMWLTTQLPEFALYGIFHNPKPLSAEFSTPDSALHCVISRRGA